MFHLQFNEANKSLLFATTGFISGFAYKVYSLINFNMVNSVDMSIIFSEHFLNDAMYAFFVGFVGALGGYVMRKTILVARFVASKFFTFTPKDDRKVISKNVLKRKK